MNGKKAKQIRRMLKNGGVDWSDAKHVQQVGKDHDGKEIRDPLNVSRGQRVYKCFTFAVLATKL